MRNLLPILLLSVATPALADDGRIEISQAAAEAGGVTPTDTAGFPVTLDTRGSYVLTSDLVVPAGVDGIEFGTDHISLDLNGFGIRGPVTCTGLGSDISCTGSAVRGIDGEFRDHASVSSGRVRGFATGILLGTRGVVRDVIVESNNGGGIEVDRESSVSDCIVVQNGGAGIEAADSSRVEGNVAAANGNAGVRLTLGGVVVGNAVSGNGTQGIDCSGCTVRHNSVRLNDGIGIAVTGTARVSGNAITTNGSHGISEGSSTGGSAAQSNMVSLNFGFQLNAFSQSKATYRENNLNEAVTTDPSVNGGWIDAGDNICSGDPNCP